MSDLLTYDVSNRIARITLNRPEKRNALNAELVNTLKLAFQQAEQDEQVRVVILKAAGEVFSAGADLEYLHQLQQNSADENLADIIELKALFETIYTLNKITIAQVEGHAIAGGCGLVSVCDIVFSVTEAKFGYTEVKIGFVPALVTCFLLEKISAGHAKQLLLSGDLIDAETAAIYGLVNFVVNKSFIEEKVSRYAQALCSGTSPGSVKLTKELMRQIPDIPLDEKLSIAVNINVAARSTADFKKGISAFLDGKKISW